MNNTQPQASDVDMQHFIKLVTQMRLAQKTYFKTRGQESLVASKELEKRVDGACVTLGPAEAAALRPGGTESASQRNAQRLFTLAATLRACAGKFREYEALHKAKGTPDGDAKAETNATMAAMCEDALATTNSTTQPQEPVAAGQAAG